VIAALVLAVVVFQANVGFAALAGAIALTLMRAADERASVAAMPWSVIMMVTGITVLVALLEKSGGMDLFTQFSGAVHDAGGVHRCRGILHRGRVDLQQHDGRVLPALLPTIPGLIQHVGGGDPMALLSSMTVGGHLVDVSPLSTPRRAVSRGCAARD
jgi:hypothetical protein